MNAAPSPEAATTSQSVAPSQAEGSFALAIEPRNATRRSALRLLPSGFSLSGARVTWYVNGAPATSAEPERFDCAGIPRGSVVSAAAVVNGREVRSSEVAIGNTPPELTGVALVPDAIGQEGALAVSANAADIDGDPVTIQYIWTVNSVLAGNGPKLYRTLRRGDAVQVKVVASDGQSLSAPVELNQTMANHPPVFAEHQDHSFMGNIFVYQAQATDLDGDRISYSLDTQIEGMNIDPRTGRLTWTVPGDFRGEQAVTIVADDGHGGSARYTVSFTLRD